MTKKTKSSLIDNQKLELLISRPRYDFWINNTWMFKRKSLNQITLFEKEWFAQWDFGIKINWMDKMADIQTPTITATRHTLRSGFQNRHGFTENPILEVIQIPTPKDFKLNDVYEYSKLFLHKLFLQEILDGLKNKTLLFENVMMSQFIINELAKFFPNEKIVNDFMEWQINKLQNLTREIA